MNENCPLRGLADQGYNKVLWDGGLNTFECISDCVIPSFNELEPETIITSDSIAHYHPDTDDAPHHFGVQLLSETAREGYYDHITEDGKANLSVEELNWTFSCRITE